MAQRPNIEEGYLGVQESFAEIGLSCDSHKREEFSLAENECEIKFKATKEVKMTTQLLDCRDESKNLSEYVFTQKKGDTIYFVINFPESGYYKFQIFALLASDERTSLPNVFNYLIRVDRALKAVNAFPKQYAQWKDGCYLFEPLVLNSSSRLHKVNFKVNIPKAKAAAVVIDGKDWHHLELKGDNFEGTVAMDHCRNKGVKVTLNANYGGESNTYPTLLEYKI